jgi:predicted ribosome quality control (RQC) complex YloA/Tae2 family protein
MLLDHKTGKVLDAIKHIPFSVSAVRPILPGAVYSCPPSGKANPLETCKSYSVFFDVLENKDVSETLQKAIYLCHNGISPVFAAEICNSADIPPQTMAGALSDTEKVRLYQAFAGAMASVAENNFHCGIYWDNATYKAVDFAVLPLSIYAHHKFEAFESPSLMLESFYSKRDESYKISQKTADMRKLIAAHTERCRKKSFVYEKTLDEIKNRDELRIKGELLTAYLYMIEAGTASFTAENFYDENKPMKISIDPTLTAAENAQKYFKQYNKQKRTFIALQEQITKNQEDINYLESVASAMENIQDEADIAEIRAELADQGFAKRRTAVKGKKVAINSCRKSSFFIILIISF